MSATIFNSTAVFWLGTVLIVMWLVQRVAFRLWPELVYSDAVYASIAAETGGTTGMVKHSVLISGIMVIMMSFCIDYVATHSEFLS